MIRAPAALSCWTMNASSGVLPASAQEPAVVAMPVVLMLSLTMIGMPRSGRSIAAAACRVGRAGVGERRRADGDDGVEGRVELADPVQVELGQLHGVQPARVHQLLELWDRGRVDVDTRDARVWSDWPRGRSARGGGHAEYECQKGGENQRSSEEEWSWRNLLSGGRSAGRAAAAPLCTSVDEKSSEVK